MRVFITGVNGQQGHDCVNEMSKRGHEVIGSDIQKSDGAPAMQTQGGGAQLQGVGAQASKPAYVSLDITDAKAVRNTIGALKPDAIIHCAAWTAVDAAEDEANKPKVHAINVAGTRNIAQAASDIDAKMVYISTDYVFDGQGERPWQPDDKNYAPLNVYGQTKLEGELAVSSILSKYYIVRIAWVFGVNGKNFIKTMLQVGKTHDTVRVVNDQIGTPTYTLRLGKIAGGHGGERQVWLLSCHQRRGLHQLVRLHEGNLQTGRHDDDSAAGHDRGIWAEQSSAALQQPIGQEQACRGGLPAAAGLAGCAGEILRRTFSRRGRVVYAQRRLRSFCMAGAEELDLAL